MKRIHAFLGFILLLWSCTFENNSSIDIPVAGATLVRSGSAAFRIGGRDADGIPLNQVSYAKIQLDGSFGQWYSTHVLPFGLADASAVAVGNMLYILGGTSIDGPSDKILYAQIDATGAFVYGWLEHGKPLPWALGNAAAAVHDGRIFLIGGRGLDGDRREIIHTRIRQDGQLGHWYRSSGQLPLALSRSAAAVIGDQLFVAGGRAGSTTQNLFVRYSIGSDGQLANREVLSLPGDRERAVLIADGLDLLLCGGLDGQGEQAPALVLSGAVENPDWVELGEAREGVVGTGYIKAGGVLYTLDQDGILDQAFPGSGILLFPDTPLFFPGSGYVPSTFYLRSNLDPASRVLLNNETLPATTILSTPINAWPLTVQNGLDQADPEQIPASLFYQSSPYATNGLTIDARRVTWVQLLEGAVVTLQSSSAKPGLLIFEVVDPFLGVPESVLFRLDFSLEFSAGDEGGQDHTSWLNMYEYETMPFTPVLDFSGQALVGLEASSVLASTPAICFSLGDYSDKSSYPQFYIGFQTDAPIERTFVLYLKVVLIDVQAP